MKFSSKDFFSKYDQIRRILQICETFTHFTNFSQIQEYLWHGKFYLTQSKVYYVRKFFPIFQLLFLFFSAFSPKKISQFWIWKFSPFWKSSVEYYLKVGFLFWLPCFLKKNIKAKVFAHQRTFFWPISESLCLRNAKNLYFVFPLDNIG